MRILTLTQPWATLVAIGAKTVETRSWNTTYRGPLAIHAAKGLPGNGRNDLRRICRQGKFARALNGWLPDIEACVGSSARPLPLGVILAVCDLAETHRIRPAAAHLTTAGELVPPAPPFEPPDGERAFGDYAPGRYAWVLAAVLALPSPIPYVGGLGLRNLPDTIAEQMLEAAQSIGGAAVPLA